MRTAVPIGPLCVAAFLLGLWLLLAPFAFGYGIADGRLTLHTNDVLAGAAVVMVAVVGMMALEEAPWTGPLLCVAGLWVALAPFVLDHRAGTDATAATVNDWAVGGGIAVLGAALAFLAHRLR
ncbi:SPW repeat protein [Saccharothrix sp. NPDC042600]|uniref:SPW repeat domain-containing protein n=1 Tax=Saccharothrix TaxID=2071 RepID=UPI0033F7DBB3|nr:hypothetical protein GCM10017745_50190 [Saccharothrix mutabilis subsp. capreolus]